MHVRLQSLPTLTWRISGRPRLSEIECSASFCANLFIKSAATPAVATSVADFSRHVVILALAFFRMPQGCAGAIEWLRISQRYIDNWIDELEKIAIRRLFVEIVGLVADGVTLPAFHSVIVVIQHFLERPAINYGLITLE